MIVSTVSTKFECFLTYADAYGRKRYRTFHNGVVGEETIHFDGKEPVMKMPVANPFGLSKFTLSIYVYLDTADPDHVLSHFYTSVFTATDDKTPWYKFFKKASREQTLELAFKISLAALDSIYKMPKKIQPKPAKG